MTGTERKVFQKYYPPDFDPSKLPRAKQPKNRQWVQRVMTPFNMRCNTCNEYIYKGKKFNMKREPADEFYLGMRIWRFYFKCPNCLADISFKTDLENCDYQAENGATRLFEAFKLWKDGEKAKEMKEEEDAKDPMKMLEKRTKMSRAEMEAMGKLEEIQEQNRRHEGVDIDGYLDATDSRLSLAEQLRIQEKEDELYIRKLYGKKEDGRVERRLKEEEEEEEMEEKPSLFPDKVDVVASRTLNRVQKIEDLPDEKRRDVEKRQRQRIDQKDILSKALRLKRVKVDPKVEEPSTSAALPAASVGLAGLAGYGSGSDSD